MHVMAESDGRDEGIVPAAGFKSVQMINHNPEIHRVLLSPSPACLHRFCGNPERLSPDDDV